jgi:DNA-binding MarR family transcriptional regulator
VDGPDDVAVSDGSGPVPGGHGLVDAVLAASQMMVAVAARSLDAAASDVTLPQFRVLVMLSLRGAQRPGDIAADLAVEPSTATRMCDRLVRKELVSRRHSAENRRAVVVELTPSGHELVRTVMQRRRREFERLAASVPAGQHDALISALGVLIGASGARPDRDWALWA